MVGTYFMVISFAEFTESKYRYTDAEISVVLGEG